jgi:hypothetical protein
MRVLAARSVAAPSLEVAGGKDDKKADMLTVLDLEPI